MDGGSLGDSLRMGGGGLSELFSMVIPPTVYTISTVFLLCPENVRPFPHFSTFYVEFLATIFVQTQYGSHVCHQRAAMNPHHQRVAKNFVHNQYAVYKF